MEQGFSGEFLQGELLDQLQDGLFVVDSDLRFRLWNGGAERILGYPAEALLGKACGEEFGLCAADSKSKLPCELTGERCIIERAFAGKLQGKYPHIVFMRRADGEMLPLSVTLSLLTGRDGKKSVACSFREMAEEYQQLRLAGEIQRQMVTSRPIDRGGIKVDTLFKPLELTGGDFVEAFFNDAGLLITVAADATGHGISAALFAMIFKTLFHSSLAESYSPSEMLEYINNRFLEMLTIEGYYLTATIIVFDPESLSGYYSSAGHPETLVFSGGDEKPFLAMGLGARGYMIGMVEGSHYPDERFSLAKGESLVLATDGLFEAEDPEGHAFGKAGIGAYFQTMGMDSDLELLYEELLRRSSPNELQDDVSLIRIRIR